MVSVRVIERRLPWGWETLLVVNGVVGRAEDMFQIERLPHPVLTLLQVEHIFRAWLNQLPKPIAATAPTAEFAPFAEV